MCKPQALCFPRYVQVEGALRGVGDSQLADKFNEARTKIRRDVIFAASLYL